MDSSIPAQLELLAQNKPTDVAFTFIDYEVNPDGFEESLTWSELYQKVQVVAQELHQAGSVGDRVAILAPQGMHYILGLLGALEAGLIAVPLPVPMLGVHDERVSAVLKDCAPVAVITTSSAVDFVMSAIADVPGAPLVIELDSLDLDTPAQSYQTRRAGAKVAILQYTSGSTGTPVGVVVTHDNIAANFKQVRADYFADIGGVPPDTTWVSWLPFYHDMGLMLGIFGSIALGGKAVLTSPMAFLQKPARWIQLMARSTNTFSAAPNFAFELAVQRTSEADMAGLDLGNVLIILSGAERVNPATLRRFTDRFAPHNLPDTTLRASYGLAEATVYVASGFAGKPSALARFSYENLSAGYAKRCEGEGGVDMVSHGPPRACTLRIVDPDTCTENPAGKVGEIWVHGENVPGSYWRNPQRTQRTFGGVLTDPSPGTPEGPWLRTGDLGVLSDGELFIVGRIKDLLIVDGRNHYPDDIEATVQEISGGRVAAISVTDDSGERLVAIVELKKRGSSEEEVEKKLQAVRHAVAAAISKAHGLRSADIVLVPPGSIPITTSGKIRRSDCRTIYGRQGFSRLVTSG